jgi:hypothetical protein
MVAATAGKSAAAACHQVIAIGQPFDPVAPLIGRGERTQTGISGRLRSPNVLVIDDACFV